MIEHPFEIGETYTHKKFGTYQVLSFDGDRMQVQFADGNEKSLKIGIQARIWRNALDDASATILLKQAQQRRMTRGGKTEPIRLLVQDALLSFSKPYTEDIIDQLCHHIETNRELRRRYNEIVERFDRSVTDGQGVVNNWLGKYTAQLTNMVATAQAPCRKATIISSFSLLKPDILDT